MTAQIKDAKSTMSATKTSNASSSRFPQRASTPILSTKDPLAPIDNDWEDDYKENEDPELDDGEDNDKENEDPEINDGEDNDKENEDPDFYDDDDDKENQAPELGDSEEGLWPELDELENAFDVWENYREAKEDADIDDDEDDLGSDVWEDNIWESISDRERRHEDPRDAVMQALIQMRKELGERLKRQYEYEAAFSAGPWC